MKKAIINKGMMKMDKEKMGTFFEGLIAIIIQRNAGNDSSPLDQDSSGVNHNKRVYCSILSSHPIIDYCKKEYDKEGYNRFGFDIIFLF